MNDIGALLGLWIGKTYTIESIGGVVYKYLVLTDVRYSSEGPPMVLTFDGDRRIPWATIACYYVMPDEP